MQADAIPLSYHGLQLCRVIGSGEVCSVYLAEDVVNVPADGKPTQVCSVQVCLYTHLHTRL